jgi:uncharacterized protein YajQ (UPF0234 family)
MPSFDIVSEVDLVEVSNAVDQANREVSTRFDFKGVDADFRREENLVHVTAESDFQLQQMLDMLTTKLARRGVDVACMEVGDPVVTGKQARQIVTLRQGIDGDLSRQIVKLVKAQKIKVQAAIQGEKVRISGKKRDDLQKTIAMVKQADIDLPLQFSNFRD